jgi:hypothetical protein
MNIDMNQQVYYYDYKLDIKMLNFENRYGVKKSLLEYKKQPVRTF